MNGTFENALVKVAYKVTGSGQVGFKFRGKFNLAGASLVAVPGAGYEGRDYLLLAVDSLTVDLAEAGILTAVVVDTLIIDLESKEINGVVFPEALFIAGYDRNGETLKYLEY